MGLFLYSIIKNGNNFSYKSILINYLKFLIMIDGYKNPFNSQLICDVMKRIKSLNKII